MSIIDEFRNSGIKESKFTTVGKYTPKKLFTNYISIKEIKDHPEIMPALKCDIKIKLDILSKYKPKLINIKHIKNQDKLKFSSKLNSFYNLFFNNNINKKNSKKEELNILSEENKAFLTKYKDSNPDKDKEKFDDIKFEYEKRNYYVSPINKNKNLFKENILLSNKEKLKKIILNDLSTPKTNNKSIFFLYNINRQLGDKSTEKKLKILNNISDKNSFKKDKIKKEQNDEILKTQNDIINAQTTLNSIDGMDNFFTLDNKKYLEFLKSGDSRDGSSAKKSTRFNSVLNYYENLKDNYISNKNKNINTIKLQKLQKKVIYKNRHQIHKNTNLNYENNSNHCIKTVDNNDLARSTLEKLYDKISDKERLIDYQSDINNYLKNRKYDEKISPYSICQNFEKTREKICKSIFLKQDMNLMKEINGNIENAERVRDNDIKTKSKVFDIENKMVKIYCNINNPRNNLEK